MRVIQLAGEHHQFVEKIALGPARRNTSTINSEPGLVRAASASATSLSASSPAMRQVDTPTACGAPGRRSMSAIICAFGGADERSELRRLP
jgi:hypothetical protein